MERMQLINDFFTGTINDARITTAHISLYFALFYYDSIKDNNGILHAFARDIIPLAKHSSTTYHKCLQDLHDFGYLKYIPSYSSVLGSLIVLGQQSIPGITHAKNA
ncbi:MAG: hypothetical protein P4L51_23425 [Puia sp.]|nr:hypothetical protein [Puia sp.]